MCGNWANTALSRRGERLGNHLLVENLLFFSLGGQQFLLEVMRQGGGFAAGLGAFWGWGLRLGAGSIADPTPVGPRPAPANRHPPKKTSGAYLCIQLNHRQMFIWASNGFGFLFLSYLT